MHGHVLIWIAHNRENMCIYIKYFYIYKMVVLLPEEISEPRCIVRYVHSLNEQSLRNTKKNATLTTVNVAFFNSTP